VAVLLGLFEGLALFKARDFDLLVTDHLLGRDTGTAMAKEMNLLSPFVPIIVLSGATKCNVLSMGSMPSLL
jgi:DNA-binding response OmpR family regulator